MKRLIPFLSLLLLCALILAACSGGSSDEAEDDGKTVYYGTTEDELYEYATYVILAEKTGNETTVKTKDGRLYYPGYTLSEVTVNKTYKGNLQEGDTVIVYDPYLSYKKNDKMITMSICKVRKLLRLRGMNY